MPFEAAEAPGWEARLALAFERRGARTVLAKREHAGPLVVQKALHPEGDAVCHAIVLHPPAGIAGGDRLTIEADVAAGGHAFITTPGAAKWYRANGRAASQQVVLRVEAGACLEWLPQETLVFDGAISRQRCHVHLAGDARHVAWDIQCLGRTGSGESFTRGELALETRITRDGRLAWIERGRIAAPMQALHAAAGLSDQPVFGTFVVAAPAIDPGWLSLAREVVAHEGEGAVTALPGVLLARYRGAGTEAARGYFAQIWMRLREPVLGRAAIVPRIWQT